MKKLLLSGLLVIGALASQAQINQINGREPICPTNEKPVNRNTGLKLNKANIESWYSPADIVQSALGTGNQLNGFVDFLYHDTIAKSVLVSTQGEESTVNGFGYMTVGQVLDPKDEAILNSDNPGILLSRYVGFKVDSVGFNYRYVRHVDSLPDGLGQNFPVVDTLFVSYFRGSQITTSGLVFTGPPQRTVRYASAGWTGGDVRMPSNVLDRDTILLTINDTTSAINNAGFENRWTSKGMTLAAPTNMTIAGNLAANASLVGYALTFKSGVPSVVGTDTAIMIYQKDPSTLPVGARRTNYFGYSLFTNSGDDYENPTYFNTGMFVDGTSGYTPWVVNATVTFNGYIPGIIYTNERFTDLQFHLTTTTDNVGLKNIEDQPFAVGNVYPNPAKSFEKAAVVINMKKAAEAQISIVNLLGATVKPATVINLTEGVNVPQLDLTGLKAGVYFINVTVEGSNQTKKITVTE